MAKPNKYRFRKHDSIGRLSAEEDETYLYECFVDTGALEILRNTRDPRGILLGRTGAGKSALMTILEARESRAVHIDVHNVAVSYIVNSSILRFFEELGVRLEPFFKLLWRHIFVVEILKQHLEITGDHYHLDRLDRIQLVLRRKRAYLEAYEYLQTWSRDFFITIEERSQEITSRMEHLFEAQFGVQLKEVMELGAHKSDALSEERRIEFVRRGQRVIDEIQLGKLEYMFEALDTEILVNTSQRYYILVDQLDEDWVDENIRYSLIRALIETMRDFNRKIDPVKVVVGLRTDLFDQTITSTSDLGFQVEKYRDLCLEVVWTKQELVALLDARIDSLVRQTYTSASVSHKDVLSPRIAKGGQLTIDYLIERTLLRPRDLINFFNICIQHSEGQPTVRPANLRKAEATYSKGRRESLCNEWVAVYPYLDQALEVLKNRPRTFSLCAINQTDIDDFCVSVYEHFAEVVPQWLRSYFDGYTGPNEARCNLVKILFRTGAIGLKLESFYEVRWAHVASVETLPNNFHPNTKVNVHPILWHALGINPN